MNIIESLKWRYAVKKFDNLKILSKNKINTLKNAFNLTPTAFGLQPVSLIIVHDKKIQETLVKHSMGQQQVGNASHVFILAIPKNYGINDVENYFSLVKKIRNTPDDILNPFKEYLTTSVANQTQIALFEQNKRQAYLVLGNLLTTCAVEKIDACPIEGFSPEKYDEILDLSSKNLTSVLALPIGYRAKDDFMKDLKKVRKDISETIIEIT